MNRTMIVLLAFALAPLGLNNAVAQPDATFTYQGELRENGELVTGIFDLTFSLWDSEVGGFQLSNQNALTDVPVVGGKFSVDLNFGASPFNNADRWLGTAVNGVTLSPRTQITRAPYAIQTRGIFVDGDNDVGIDRLNPSAKLHVGGVAPALRLDDDGGSGHLELKDSNSTLAQIQKVNNNGSVLLDIDPMPTNGTSSATLRLFRSTNTTGPKQVAFYNGNNSTATSAVIGLGGIASYFQAHGGNFGIGTSNPLAPLHAESDTDQFPIIYGNSTSLTGTPTGVVGETRSETGTGVRGFSGATSGIGYGVRGASRSSSGFDFFADGVGDDYGSSSSRRWKSNVVEIAQPLKKISQLRGVYFDWNEDHGGHHDVGMIAEEVGKVLPEIVQYEDNGLDAIGMDYSKLTPLLVEAIKALRDEKNDEIIELRQQNSALQQLNSDLRLRVESLEHFVEKLASSRQSTAHD